MDKDLLTVIVEDLEYVTREWNTKNISDTNLRHSSNILRRLLIEGDLFTVARLFGVKKLRILSSGEEYPSRDGAVFHQSGGAKHNGIQVKSITFYDKALTDKEIKEMYQKEKQKIVKNSPISLSDFLKKPSITIQGIEINREEIIKYVTNKLGGAHYDSKRKSGNSLEEKYKLLDDHRNANKIAGKNAIYFELLSIGQKLVNNKDIQKLKKKIKNFLKRESL